MPKKLENLASRPRVEVQVSWHVIDYMRSSSDFRFQNRRLQISELQITDLWFEICDVRSEILNLLLGAINEVVIVFVGMLSASIKFRRILMVAVRGICLRAKVSQHMVSAS